MEDMDKNRDGFVTVDEYISKSLFSVHYIGVFCKNVFTV